MPGASLSMHHGRIPPAGIGLLAGLLTTAAAVALTATGLLPLWLSTPLVLFAGGLASGLAAPVRPTTGAMLGGAAGIVAAVLLTIALSLQWNPDPERYFSPFPFALIAVASVMLYVPPNAIAGAVGAAVRPRLVARGPASGERARGLTPELQQWLGIAAGALLIIGASRASILVAPSSFSAVFLVAGFAAGFVAGILSYGGARSGVTSALLSAVFGLGALALYYMGQASTATGDGVPEGLWPIALAIMGVVVLPAVALGGALGGSFRKPSGPPNAPADPDREGDGRPGSELQ